MRDNGAVILEYQVMDALVKGLPSELDEFKGDLNPSRVFLVANLSGRTFLEALPILTGVAYGVGFNDRLPWAEVSASRLN